MKFQPLKNNSKKHYLKGAEAIATQQAKRVRLSPWRQGNKATKAKEQGNKARAKCTDIRIGNNFKNKKNKTMQTEVEQIRRLKLSIEQCEEIAPKIECINDVSKYIREIREFKEYINMQEVFVAIHMNNSNKIIGYQIVSIGSDIGTVVDPKIICAAAVLALSKNVIVAHNHPSGKLEISNNDRLVTSRVKQGLALFEINLLDSLIITSKDSLSILDQC
jgi:DNA repair protein RadC